MQCCYVIIAAIFLPNLGVAFLSCLEYYISTSSTLMLFAYLVKTILHVIALLNYILDFACSHMAEYISSTLTDKTVLYMEVQVCPRTHACPIVGCRKLVGV